MHKLIKLQDIEEAKRILICPSLKKSYDSWLDSGLSVSFETWKEKSTTNMHWAKSESNTYRYTMFIQWNNKFGCTI